MLARKDCSKDPYIVTRIPGTTGTNTDKTSSSIGATSSCIGGDGGCILIVKRKDYPINYGDVGYQFERLVTHGVMSYIVGNEEEGESLDSSYPSSSSSSTPSFGNNYNGSSSTSSNCVDFVNLHVTSVGRYKVLFRAEVLLWYQP